MGDHEPGSELVKLRSERGVRDPPCDSSCWETLPSFCKHCDPLERQCWVLESQWGSGCPWVPCLHLPRGPGAETNVGAICQVHSPGNQVRAVKEERGQSADGIGVLVPAGDILQGFPELPHMKASDNQAEF